MDQSTKDFTIEARKDMWKNSDDDIKNMMDFVLTKVLNLQSNSWSFLYAPANKIYTYADVLKMIDAEYQTEETKEIIRVAIIKIGFEMQKIAGKCEKVIANYYANHKDRLVYIEYLQKYVLELETKIKAYESENKELVKKSLVLQNELELFKVRGENEGMKQAMKLLLESNKPIVEVAKSEYAPEKKESRSKY